MGKAKPKPKESKTSVGFDYGVDITLDHTSFLDSITSMDLTKLSEKIPDPLSTGIIPLDILLEGGIRDGDMLTIYSASGLGKSTIALQLSKRMIDIHGKRVFYVDVEAGISNQIKTFKLESYIENKTFSFTDDIRMASQLEKLFEAILSEKNLRFDFIVIDSITNVLDDSIFTRSITDQMVASQAKVITAFLQKFKIQLKARGITTVLINQERANLEAQTKYDKKTKPAGCQALKFNPDVVIRLRSKEGMKDRRETPNGIEEIEIGKYLLGSADKNRKSLPGISISFPLVFGKGISNVMFLTKLLKDKGYVKQAGAYFKTTMLPNPNGEEWSLQGLKGLTKFVDANFDAINNILINDQAYRLVVDVEGDDDEV